MLSFSVQGDLSGIWGGRGVECGATSTARYFSDVCCGEFILKTSLDVTKTMFDVPLDNFVACLTVYTRV